jgi:hypothetical protein
MTSDKYRVSKHTAALLVLALARAGGQDNMSCVAEIEIPRYSFVARRAAQTGTVEVDLRVSESGAAEDIKSIAPDDSLIQEVEAFLKAKAKFLLSCSGQRVHMLFTFRLEGEARSDPFSIVKFRPPNHFIITSQPKLPTIDVIPVKPGKAK